MKVELNRYDIIHLLRTQCPMYEIIEKIPTDLGHFVGGICDDFKWASQSKINESRYTDKELYEIYRLCADSWLEFCQRHKNVNPFG